VPHGFAEQRVALVRAQERRVVVVEREDEAKAVEPGLGLRAQREASVGVLPGAPELAAEVCPEDPVAEGARGVACEPGRKREGIRTARARDELTHGSTLDGGRVAVA
jgi:hypothetical protein